MLFYSQASTHMPASDEPADMVAARNAILAGLVLPDEVPADTLSPLSIPAPLSLQEFIANLSGVSAFLRYPFPVLTNTSPVAA